MEYTIEDNIASCDIFLVIVTFAALKSSNVEKEVLQARNRNKKIIPCFYGRVKRNELKWGLGELQGIEFTNKNELAREIYWRIYQYQNKGQVKSDATIQEPAEPAIQEPAIQEPAIQEPAIQEPAIQEPAIQEPAIQEPAIQEPAIQEPAIQEPAIEPEQEMVKEPQ